MNKFLKKNLSALLAFIMALSCLTGFMFVNAQDGIVINAQNFPDDNFRNFVSMNYDNAGGVQDGILSADETTGVTTMPVFYFGMDGIKNLKGIEYFTELTSLYAGAIGLEEVDLSALSKLETLNVDGNELTSLDLSANQALKTVHCRGNEKLTTLILPPSVTDLQCDECAITELDLSACTQLLVLNCYANELTQLDLSNNTALQELRCSNNHLSSLDLSNNTALKGVMNQNIGNQTVNISASANGKTVSAPVNGLDAQRVVSTTLSDGGYNANTQAFEFTDYNAAQNGFDYYYNVNLAGAENIDVHVNVTKNFYKVSFYESDGGNLIDYSYAVEGGTAQAPAFPQAPEGFACPSWSADLNNITADTDVYVVWNQNHSYELVAYSGITATVKCSVCGSEYQKSLEDCFNAKRGDADYDAVLDYNGDGYINARDHVLMVQDFG